MPFKDKIRNNALVSTTLLYGEKWASGILQHEMITSVHRRNYQCKQHCIWNKIWNKYVNITNLENLPEFSCKHTNKHWSVFCCSEYKTTNILKCYFPRFRHLMETNLWSEGFIYMYIYLLTKREIRVAGYWLSSFLRVYRPRHIRGL